MQDYMNEIKEIVDKLQDTDTIKGKDVKAIYNTLIDHIDRLNERHLAETKHYSMIIMNYRKQIHSKQVEDNDKERNYQYAMDYRAKVSELEGNRLHNLEMLYNEIHK